MRVHHIVASAIVFMLVSIGDVSATTGVEQIQHSRTTTNGITSASEIYPAMSNRFLRQRKTDEDDEERSNNEAIAAQFKGLLPTIRSVSNMQLGAAVLTMQQMRLPQDKIKAIFTLLKMSPKARKEILMLIQ
ncbi:Putative RxLR effector [Phytophthora palmivora]|uniref:RxLR effector protein n=1 Tax=Phytophthora palmivora TaxID=4796 RepID=A0A1L5SBA9_9STRA|nr:REX4 [Phytophthora palmivora]POM66552.1 Putative RxLR effector [Phytophthora palmivora]